MNNKDIRTARDTLNKQPVPKHAYTSKLYAEQRRDMLKQWKMGRRNKG